MKLYAPLNLVNCFKVVKLSPLLNHFIFSIYHRTGVSRNIPVSQHGDPITDPRPQPNIRARNSELPDPTSRARAAQTGSRSPSVGIWPLRSEQLTN